MYLKRYLPVLALALIVVLIVVVYLISR